MVKRLAATVLILSFLCSCRRPSPPPTLNGFAQLERVPSAEVQLTARLIPDTRPAQTLQITLRNVGQRRLTFDTGYARRPIAFFSFSLELPDHSFGELNCSDCAPASFFGQFDPYTVELLPGQAHQFAVPLSVFFGVDPRNGEGVALQHLHGRMLIEVHVPTPPKAAHNWPGYVSASVPLL